jgi:hypothetical protein
MSGLPLLVYCGGKNRRHAEIAREAGFAYGVCSGHKAHRPVAFLDLDYRRPLFARHLEAARRHHPRIAVAGDAEDTTALATVIAQAEALRPYAEEVVIVPKQTGLVAAVPDWCVVGLSVPTRFGATQAPYWEYVGRRLHLLGGSPQTQMLLWRYFGESILSVDGNSHRKAARWGTFWQDGGWVSGAAAAAIEPPGPDLYARAFARSCRNMATAWRILVDAPEEGAA